MSSLKYDGFGQPVVKISKVAARSSKRKEHILRTAAQLFARLGYHATSIEDLTAAIPLGRGALYYHITSKEELLFQISKLPVEEMIGIAQEIVARDASPPEKFRELSQALMKNIAGNLAEWSVFFREINSLTGARRVQIVKLRDRFEGMCKAILKDGVDQGLFRVTDPVVIKGILGLYNYSYVWIKPRGRMRPEDIADAFSDLVLSGLLADHNGQRAYRRGQSGGADSVVGKQIQIRVADVEIK
jgi:AcrR family transcriptional regulator